MAEQQTVPPAGQKKEETKALSPIATIRNLVEKNKSQLEKALPKYMSVDRLNRIFVTCIQKTPRLGECHPITLLGALFQCGQLGLEPDPVIGEAYLVPFKNNKKDRYEVQLIVGYKGLIKLATNSGKVSMIYAREVYEKDEFSFEYGTQPFIKHVQSKLPIKERGPVTHCYSVARLTDGNVQFEVMTKEEIELIRKRSKSGSDGPWVTDWIEMGRKTPTRKLCKYLPKSAVDSSLLLAVGLDERAELGKPQDLGLLAPDSNEVATPEDEQKPAPSMPKEIGDAQEPAE